MEALRMYGRGMPRPIAEVTSYTEERTAYYWVAACRDRTTPSTHSNNDFNQRRATATHSRSNFIRRKKNGILMGRGMPRPYNNCTPKQQQLQPTKEQLRPHSNYNFNRRRTTAPHSNSNFNQQKKQLHPITAAIAPAQGAATPPFLPLHSQLPPPPILHEPQNKTRLYLLHLKKNA